jgi:hypothetical protein
LRDGELQQVSQARLTERGPTCGNSAELSYYIHHLEEESKPSVSAVDLYSCPQGCQPSEEELTGLIP